MSIREDIERMECETLSPYATLSIHSRGRDDPEEQCDIRPVFQRDRDRISFFYYKLLTNFCYFFINHSENVISARTAGSVCHDKAHSHH